MPPDARSALLTIPASCSRPLGGRRYSLYYMIFFLIFLIVFIFGVAVLASVVGDCKAICTLQTDPAGTEDTSNPDDLNIPGATCVKERGYCGDVDECTTAATVLDKNVRDAFNQECFYCDGATIKWPNFASAGREQWQPVGSCSDTSIPEGYGGVDRDGNSLCWNVPAEVRPWRTLCARPRPRAAPRRRCRSALPSRRCFGR